MKFLLNLIRTLYSTNIEKLRQGNNKQELFEVDDIVLLHREDLSDPLVGRIIETHSAWGVIYLPSDGSSRNIHYKKLSLLIRPKVKQDVEEPNYTSTMFLRTPSGEVAIRKYFSC